MCQVTIDVPDSALADLRQDPDTRAREVRVAAAIGLYASGRVSLAEATEVAGIGRVLFADRLRDAHVPVHRLTTEDLALEFAGG